MEDSQFGYKQKFLKKENTVSVLGSRGGLNAVRKRLLRSSYCATARLVLNGSSALAQRERERESLPQPLSGGGDLVQCSEFAILGLFSGVPAEIQRMRAINHPPRVDSRNCLWIVQSSIE
jgi:hypothetical protein